MKTPPLRTPRNLRGVSLLLLLLTQTTGGCSKQADPPRNLLLISIDTCRADHLSAYGYWRETSPALDALAARGVLFESAFCQVPDTTPSHASLFTSVYPYTHGAANGVPLKESATTLAEVLRKANFKTAGFVSGATMTARDSGLAQGFDVYDDELDRINPKGIPFERRAVGTTERALEWLRNSDQERFFLFVHYFDPHTQYDPPSPYDSMFSADRAPAETREKIDPEHIPAYAKIGSATDLEVYQARYDGEIRYVDEQVSRLFAQLETLGLQDDTLVVVTSDHGEDMGEHGVYFNHGWTLFDPALHIPLIFSCPGHMPSGRRVEDLVQTIDVLPTILDMLDVAPGSSMEGMSLRGLLSGGKAPPNRYNLSKTTKTQTYLRVNIERDVTDLWALRTPEWKLVYYEDGSQKCLLNMEKDPEEQSDVMPSNRKQTARMMQHLRELLRGLKRDEGSGREQLTRKELHALKRDLTALGYIR